MVYVEVGLPALTFRSFFISSDRLQKLTVVRKTTEKEDGNVLRRQDVNVRLHLCRRLHWPRLPYRPAGAATPRGAQQYAVRALIDTGPANLFSLALYLSLPLHDLILCLSLYALHVFCLVLLQSVFLRYAQLQGRI
ncbi:hypothetical protein E2C01_003891 [Portunus trituberculatus]|uniref:Uncharacterized protein n=1 Tax=Portunus trituberculatus TaxID=210409 RepID=A0A5B7CP55_PORTR|nr:hypothetical protein [Portunus trituberculatus]